MALLSLDVEANRRLVGPFFVGMIINYLLWGIQICQTYYYYKAYRHTDRLWFKTGVAVLFVLDMYQSVAATQGIWHFLVDGWGNPQAVTTPLSLGFDMIPIADSLTASTVHLIYAHKIWLLLEAPFNYIGTGTVLLLSLCQLAGGIGCFALVVAIEVTIVSFYHIKKWSIVWLVASSLTDIVITLIMSWRLSQSRTGFKRTDDVISRLIRSVVETGLAPAVVQVLDLVVFLVWPAQSYHVTLTVLSPKVYSNSMMALLNSRHTGKAGDVWTSQHTSGQDIPVEGIQIRTTQTVNVVDDFELTPHVKRDLSPNNIDSMKHAL